MFLDERSVPTGEGRTRLIVACVVCEERRWTQRHATAQGVGRLRRKRRLDAIENALKQIRAFGVVAYADVPAAVMIPGEIDGTSDIQKMCRTDNLWSQVFLAAVAVALACLRKASVKRASMRVLHDPKSLRGDHRDAVEVVLRQNLPAMAREDPDTHEIDASVHFECTQFEEVPKPASGSRADALQTGTVLAHYLCEQSADVIATGNRGPLLARNVTKQVMEMISPFLAGENANEKT